jgi:DNA invertase Pin-like site-specific DNA recombinase
MIFPEPAAPAPPDGEPALAYARMSHLDLDERIGDQFTRIDSFTASSNGAYHVALRFSDDGVTAWREDVVRPDFERLLEVLRTGRYRVVIVWEETRITRDPVVGAHFGAIMRRIKGKLVVTNGETHSVYDFTRQRDRDSWHEAVGKAVSESGVKSERIKRTFEVKHENREFRGGPVGFGWRVEWTRRGRKIVGTWYVEESEAALLREASERVRRGEAAITVANDFYERGVRIRHRPSTPGDTRERGVITGKTLALYLRHPRIAGLYATGNNRDGWSVHGTLSNFPAVLTEDEWRETSAALAAVGGRKRRATGTRVVHTFASYYVCFACRRSLIRNTPRAHALWRHRLGKAQSHIECEQSFSIPADKADAVVTELIDEYLRSRAWEKPTDVEQGATLQAERATIESSLAALPGAIVAGTVSLELGGQTEKGYRRRLGEIDAELARKARLTVVLDGDLAVRQWRSGDLTERRRVLSAILHKIVVVPGKDLPLHERLTVEWKTQQ